MLDSYLIQQYYTNLPFCNVLQIMKEKSSKERGERHKDRSCAQGTASPRRRNSFAEAKGSFADAKMNDCKRRPLRFA